MSQRIMSCEMNREDATMTTKHTATPWDTQHTAGHETHGQSAVYDSNGKDIAIVYDGEANAHRIVSCVNACEGLNPDGYRGVVEALEVIGNDLIDMLPSGHPYFKSVEKARTALTLARKED